MKRIAIEEHFYTEEFVHHLRSNEGLARLETTIDEKGNKIDRLEYFVLAPGVVDSLLDLGEGRIQQMDKDGIDMQVLSLMNPGLEVFDAATGAALAKSTNDELADVIQKYPDRFSGFAALPMLEPEVAADELERSVKMLGLKGAMVKSHVRGEFLDDTKYWVIFERAEKLGVPIYLHPNVPPRDMLKPYLTYKALTGSMLGFAHETALHAMRLICSGLFDRFPRLIVILGHLGEALPFWMGRFDTRWQREGLSSDPISSKIKRNPTEYIRDNFLVTTSGILWQPALMCTYLSLGAEKILFSVDYPLQASKETVDFIDSASICQADKEKIYHSNAEKLLSL